MAFFFGFNSHPTFAASYTLSLSTSGNVNLNAIPGSASINTDTLEVISTCPLGYDVTIKGPQDNTLYKDGNKSHTELNKKINASTGTKLNPVQIIGNNLGTWGYRLGNDTTISSNFIGLTHTETNLFSKNTASGGGGSNKDTLPVYFGASATDTTEDGTYTLSESSPGAGDAGVSFYLTTSISCVSYNVSFNPTSTAGGETVTGTGTMSPQTILEDTPTNLNANTFIAPEGYEFIGWNTAQDGTGTTYQNEAEVTNLTSVGQSITLYAMWQSLGSHIDVTADAAGTMTVANKWSTPVKVRNLTQGTTSQSVNSDSTIDITVTTGDIVRIAEGTANTTFRSFYESYDPLVSGVSSHISYMPDMNKFTTDTSGTTAGSSFFYSFNESGSLTSLPDGSFDTSNITTVGNGFFDGFNTSGSLTSLPDGSFDTGNITTASHYFFSDFNNSGSLTSLPDGSFDTSNITIASDYFFTAFNYSGSLTSLPDGSFDTSNITTVGTYFFTSFNQSGSLTSLPAGSFNTSNITSAGTYFLYRFNYAGHLSTLPYGSFSTSQITTSASMLGSDFMRDFNYSGYLQRSTTNYNPDFVNKRSSAVDAYYGTGSSGSTSSVSIASGANFYYMQDPLPPAYIDVTADAAGTMVVANKWTTPVKVQNLTQGTTSQSVNSNSNIGITVATGDVVRITEGTANTTFRSFSSSMSPLVTGVSSHISYMPDMNKFTTDSTGTTAGNDFFSSFNYSGSLTSLPDGSFDTSDITIAGNYFFYLFNDSGRLTSLPAGSFNTSNITTVGNNFFNSFNDSGRLTSLPDGSFDTSNITTVGNYFFSNFNRSGSLTSLPDGSFGTSNITTAGNGFFYGFNYSGSLTSLPDGSFDISNITTAGNNFFDSFNYSGSLTSLPDGSFDTSNITTADTNFLYRFNYRGHLSTLPYGSFSTSQITTSASSLGSYFMREFNYNGYLQQSTTNYNPDFVNKYSSAVDAYYGTGSSGSFSPVSIASGANFYYMQDSPSSPSNTPSNNPASVPSSTPTNAPSSVPSVTPVNVSASASSSRSGNTKATTTNNTATTDSPDEPSIAESDQTNHIAPLGVTSGTDDDTSVTTETTITNTNSFALSFAVAATVSSISAVVFFILSRRNNKDE